MANNNNSPPREIRVNVPVVLPQGALLQVPPITYGRQRQATPPAAARPPFICGCGCSGQAASSSNVDGNIGIPDSALHTEVDPTVSDAYKVIYQSISCIKRFRNQSPEEIRLQYLAENPNYRHAAEAQKWPADFALNMLTQSTSGSTYWGLIKWMIKQELPLSLIDNADSQAFFNNSVYQGPGSIREQVIGTLNSLHDSLRIQLLDEFEKLENANGARNLHVALGPLSEKGYATLTVHFLPDGKKSLESVIVDHIHIRRQDNPSSIAQKVHASLTKFNIQNQCHSFIDSTSRSVGDAITPLFPRWNARSHEVHCVVQTLNKFMLAILKPFMVFESDAGDDELDLSALNLGHYVSSVQDSPFFSREVLRKMNKAVDAASEQTVKDAGEVDPKIVSESKLTFAKLLELFSVLVELEFAPFKSKISFTSVEDGHWFTFFKAMSLILDHKPEVEAFLGSETIVLDLEHVKLSKNDWNMLESLGPILKALNLIATRLSATSTPSVHQVISIHNFLSRKCAEVIGRDDCHPVVLCAVQSGSNVLSSDFASSGRSASYYIAAMMHPMFKTAFLRSMGWPEEWIENVKMIVQNIWEKNYQKETQEPKAPSQTDSLHEIDDWRYNNGSENDALQTYLALEPVLRCEDPIEYWVSQQNTQIVPAPLAQMALEYLGAPATSVDCQRFFAVKKPVVSPVSLDLREPENRVIRTLHSWMLHPSLAPEGWNN